ncbi:LADA_0E02476g1_1 [Lachancea dasiensis]|uniref:Prefoldin subunit 4 n=1 Tax=Lachancea dasiensis TaxID=1072105 RepID=A0A1G4JAV5_9SACH|nr:LADA_0E02476g1_1 [Lachancea dasiensis]
MELLPEGKKNSVQVLYEDQQKINEFSKLIMRKDSVTQELELLKQEKSYLDDVSLEIELIDEDEQIQYKIGETFVFMKQGEVVAQLEKDGELLDAKIDQLEESESGIDSRIGELKAGLYAKFGDNINLER